jgi:tRNA U54 and U55 pseudouridine synthase Pus10
VKTNQKKYKIDEENCFRCQRHINRDTDNFVNLITYNLGEKIESVVFHCNCWGEYNTDKVNERFKQTINMGMNMLRGF